MIIDFNSQLYNVGGSIDKTVAWQNRLLYKLYRTIGFLSND
jgi:hypothetical protein